MLRRTKIVATLGPSTDDAKTLDRIVEAGVDVVRLNFSYDNWEKQRDRADKVRSRARSHGRQIGILADLQGPKIRIERFREGGVFLEEGCSFMLDAGCPLEMPGAETRRPKFGLNGRLARYTAEF